MIKIFVVLLYIIIMTPGIQAQPPLMFKKCQACHGKQLTGKKKNPSIVGLPYEKLYASMTTNIPKKMRRISSKLTDSQKVVLSEYIFNLGEK